MLNKGARKNAARALFEALNSVARDPDLFEDGRFADDPDGRFEAMALMSAALFQRLAGRGPACDELAQDVFNLVFKTFDQALRLLGVGDLHVGKRIRKMAESYYGRMHAYREPLAAKDHGAVSVAIARNAFLQNQTVVGRDDMLASAAIAWLEKLEATEDDALLSGKPVI
jgi:cytochrome b pre-mRNA-processing protein 3